MSFLINDDYRVVKDTLVPRVRQDLLDKMDFLDLREKMENVESLVYRYH